MSALTSQQHPLPGLVLLLLLLLLPCQHRHVYCCAFSVNVAWLAMTDHIDCSWSILLLPPHHHAAHVVFFLTITLTAVPSLLVWRVCCHVDECQWPEALRLPLLLCFPDSLTVAPSLPIVTLLLLLFSAGVALCCFKPFLEGPVERSRVLYSSLHLLLLLPPPPPPPPPPPLLFFLLVLFFSIFSSLIFFFTIMPPVVTASSS